jgi:hypothetical protein
LFIFKIIWAIQGSLRFCMNFRMGFFGGSCGWSTGVWTQGFMLCEECALLLEPCLQSILLLLWRWDFTNYLSGLASNHDPPDLGLQREPPMPGKCNLFVFILPTLLNLFVCLFWQ